MTPDERRTERMWRLYEDYFREPRPQGWEVRWGYDGAVIKRTDLDNGVQGIILFAFASMHTLDDRRTVIHELIHVNDPTLPHGKEFQRRCRSMLAVTFRLGHRL